MHHRIIAITLFTAAGLLAQGPRGPQNRLSPNHPASALNMTKLQTITGPVDGINMAYGTRYPSLSVNKTLIKVAPVWYFLQMNFEIKSGDVLTVVAAPSIVPNDAYLYAVEISNAAAKAVIVLRDSAGVPLWSGAGRGSPDAPRNGAGCVEPASIATAAGVIDKLSAGAGIQNPSMVLKAGNETLVSIKLGPERILLESDLELSEGQAVSVRYAQESYTGEYIALAITNGAGVTVTLRHDDGTPNWD